MVACGKEARVVSDSLEVRAVTSVDVSLALTAVT